MSQYNPARHWGTLGHLGNEFCRKSPTAISSETQEQPPRLLSEKTPSPASPRHRCHELRSSSPSSVNVHLISLPLSARSSIHSAQPPEQRFNIMCSWVLIQYKEGAMS
ncbi:hypothetical protein VDGE_30070 [Verticillium dahliae]|uniref:Uncharacterized protein n=1 Tax=Verticillium dahliae TaxID=27337 RepID=A0A444RRJ8_VERDA|nr:hypothetical protein VDGE_30070 [Verticillium dahliae]